MSDTEQDVEFTVYADPALSSLSGTPLLTAQTICRRQNREDAHAAVEHDPALPRCPRKFDLLSIDIEGHDKEALASLDLSEFQPELIVIERMGRTCSRLRNTRSRADCSHSVTPWWRSMAPIYFFVSGASPDYARGLAGVAQAVDRA